MRRLALPRLARPRPLPQGAARGAVWRRSLRCGAALLLLGSAAARAADDDDFFRSLDQAEALTGLGDAPAKSAAPVVAGKVATAGPAPGKPASDKPALDKPAPDMPAPGPVAAGPVAKPLAKPVAKPVTLAKPAPAATLPPAAAARGEPSIFADDEAWSSFDAAAPRSARLDPTGWAPEHGRRLAAAPQPAAPASPAAPAPAASARVASAPAGSAPAGPAAGRGRLAAIDRLGGSDPEPDSAVLPPPGASADPLDHAAAAPPAQPLEALPPLNAALKKALDARDAADIRGSERKKERSAIAFFYAAHGFTPIWSRDGRPTEAVESVLMTLAHAGDDALTIPPPPVALDAAGGADAVAASELALTEAVIVYARQATGSRVNPRDISPLIGSLPALADPGEVLERLSAAGGEAGTRLRALNPSEPRYLALRDKLDELRLARSGGGVPIPPGPTLHIGMHDRRVPLLRARLHLDPPARGDDTKFDAEVATALADYQRGNDLAPTGSLNGATLLALSGGGSSRTEGLLVANMEMWRWMPRDLGADRIEVNVPDYLVTVFHAGEPVDQHRVVVGKTDTPTPLFSNTMKYLIVNPYWNVPQSIIKKEMLPKYGDLSYLDGRGYSVNYKGGVATVRQLPGPKNALGRIKFLFPNDYSVYLHDTPSKSLFSAAKRAFSHGCVRVDQPFGFAETVLNAALPDGAKRVWSEERLDGLVGEKERYINLPVPLPIHIGYFTASVEGGRIKQRADVYGYARAVALALGQAADPAPSSAPAAERKPRVVAERTAERTRRRGAPEPVVDDGLDPQ